MVTAVLLAGCGDADGNGDTPDEATFCRLAVVNQPVAEAAASVLERLDRLAPDEIDSAVGVLRAGAEEIEAHAPRTPEAIAAEFEVRFRPDYIAARSEVEAFVESECPSEHDLIQGRLP